MRKERPVQRFSVQGCGADVFVVPGSATGDDLEGLATGQVHPGLREDGRTDRIFGLTRRHRVEAQRRPDNERGHAAAVLVARHAHQVVPEPSVQQLPDTLLRLPGRTRIIVQVRDVERRFVGHRELAHIAGMVRQHRIKSVFAAAERRGERLVQFLDEIVGAAHQVDQAGDVVLDVPAVHPGVVLAIVLAGAHPAGEAVVQRFDEVSVLVLGMEETRFPIVQIAIELRSLAEKDTLGSLTRRLRDHGHAPGVVGSAQGDGHRLALLEGMDVGVRFRLAGPERRDVAVVPEELVDPARRISAPRRQGLFQQALAADLVSALPVHVQAFDDGVGEGGHRMVRIHPPGVTVHLRKRRGPVMAVLFRHPDEGGKDILFDLPVHHHPQRMGGAIGVPDPVVVIERCTAVFVDGIVKTTPVPTVLAQADRTLEGTPVGGVKHRLLVLGAPFHVQAGKGFIPNAAAFLGHGIHIERIDFPAQVPKGLVGADERNAVTQTHLRDIEDHRDTGIPAFVGFGFGQGPLREGPRL